MDDRKKEPVPPTDNNEVVEEIIENIRHGIIND